MLFTICHMKIESTLKKIATTVAFFQVVLETQSAHTSSDIAQRGKHKTMDMVQLSFALEPQLANRFSLYASHRHLVVV